VIVVGVSGGIAAYKTPALIRRLRQAGHEVRVIPTEAALKFVGAATLEAVSGAPAISDVFGAEPGSNHVELARTADLVVVAPATADLIARYAAGMANDLLTATLLGVKAPVVLAPAMHSAMLEHPATQANLAALRQRDVIVLESPSGALTSGDTGPGRMMEPEQIATMVLELLGSGPANRPPPKSPASTAKPQAETGPTDSTWAGHRVLVSAGGTREPLDPVRYLGNTSSGKQGLAIAVAAAGRGATVTLVGANLKLDVPDGIALVPVSTALEMSNAMAPRAATADLIVMAAAVADFRPAAVAANKIKRDGHGGFSLELVANPDILAALVEARRPGQVIIGFAAETGDRDASALEHAAAKARRKGTDLTVANDVSGGAIFGQDSTRVVLLDKVGQIVGQAEGSKSAVAEAILDAVRAMVVG
jgi:phosphopantothenoylcysteine decarboxylase/phosphopantothenate--cysteine ligase